MNGDPLSPAVRTLLADQVESVTHLDVLLLVHRHRGRAWTAGEVASELRIGSSWAEDQLALLTRQAFVVREGAGYRYAPSSGEAGRAVDELAGSYQTHPVAVVAAIYSKPDQKLRNFADAFRLRKDPPEAGGGGGTSDG